MMDSGVPSSEVNMEGNAPIFWKRGYVEIEGCAGTGQAACRFEFHDVYGNKLLVGSSGEEGEADGKPYHAKVRAYEFNCSKQ